MPSRFTTTFFLPLLIICLLGTGVRAQTTELPTATPPAERGTGTLVCLIEENWLSIYISTAGYHNEMTYVNADLLRAQPQLNRMKNVRPYNRTSRYDLRPLHLQLEQLKARGWKVTAEHFGMASNTLQEFGPAVLQERYVYSFSVPAAARGNVLQGFKTPEVVFEGVNKETSSGTPGQKISILRSPEGQYLLRNEVPSAGQGYALVWEMSNADFLDSTVVARMTQLRVSGNYLNLEYEMANGKYVYRFTAVRDGYQLISVSFVAPEDKRCDLFAYRADWTGASVALAGQVNEADCAEGLEPKRVRIRITAEPQDLRSFNPGTRRLDLKKEKLSAIY